MEVIKNENGFINIWAIVLFLILILTVVTGIEASRIFNSINTVHDAVNEAVLSVATVNAPNIFGGVRESEAKAKNTVSTSEVKDNLDKHFSLKDGKAITSQGLEQFTIKNLKTKFINQVGSNLNFETTLSLEIPIYILGSRLITATKDMKVRSTYENKF